MRVHDSQAYRKMDVTRERIGRSLELREILLSILTGFSLVNAAVGFVHAMDLCRYEIVLCLLGGEGGLCWKKKQRIFLTTSDRSHFIGTFLMVPRSLAFTAMLCETLCAMLTKSTGTYYGGMTAV